MSAAEVLRFRGYCRNCGKRTLRRSYCSRRCKRVGPMRNAGCRTLQELVDRTPKGAPVVDIPPASTAGPGEFDMTAQIAAYG